MKHKVDVKNFFLKVWEYIKQARVELIVFAALLVVDLVTKAVIAATMPLRESIPLIPNFLAIYYSLNDGVAFGFLSGMGARVVLLIFIAIAVVFFSIYLYRIRGKHILGRLGLALLISGAFGNFIDRLFLGEVRDFIQIIYFGLDIPLLGRSFAIFNVADIGVTVGVVLFLIYIIFFSELGKEKKEDEGGQKSEVVIVDDTSSVVATETTEDAVQDQTISSDEQPESSSHDENAEAEGMNE